MFNPGKMRHRDDSSDHLVEDQDYNVVRFNGTYFPHPKNGYYLHFDSWRLNMRSGVWLPAYIYSEESDMKLSIGRPLRFRRANPSLGI